MTIISRSPWLGLLALVACSPAPRPGGNAVTTPGSASAQAGEPSTLTTSPPALCAARAALDDLDTRVAVPLLPMMANHQKQNMRDHLLAVQEIVLAAGRDDFASVEKAVSRIGYSPQMGQMCTHMGAGAKGFTEQAVAFHHTADSIATAARRRDRAGVMAALGTTLQACTACHETYRQHVVDQATWTRLTSMAAPAPHAPGG